MRSKIKIIFREFEGEITAVFIDSMPENHLHELTCYARIGQHGACSIAWVYENTSPVNSKDCKELLNELKGIYFPEYVLQVSKTGRLPARSSLRIMGGV